MVIVPSLSRQPMYEARRQQCHCAVFQDTTDKTIELRGRAAKDDGIKTSAVQASRVSQASLRDPWALGPHVFDPQTRPSQVKRQATEVWHAAR